MKENKRSPKLSSLIKELLSQYIKREIDLPGLVTISEVDVSPNMQAATVWVTVLGADEEDVLNYLRKHSKDMKKYLRSQVVSKYTPELQFRIDTSADYAAHMSDVIKDLED